MSGNQQSHGNDGDSNQQYHSTESYYQAEDAQPYYDHNGSYAEPVQNQQQDGDGYYYGSYFPFLDVG